MIEDFPHQAELVRTTENLRSFAVFWEVGCGKSRPIIQTAERRFARGELDVVVVLAPNGVHRNWATDEIPRHSSGSYRAAVFDSRRAGTRAHDGAIDELCRPRAGALPYLCATYEGILTPRGRDAIARFVDLVGGTARRRFLLVIDEAWKLKNPTAQSTKKVLALSKLAAGVRVLNGTPVSNSALDVYSQMRLVDENFWNRHGISSFTAFKARFAVLKEIKIAAESDRPVAFGTTAPVGADDDAVAAYESGAMVEGEELAPEPEAKKSAGQTIRVVVGFRDLDKLHGMLAERSSRLTKEDAGLQLPPQLYSRLPFELEPDQRRAYDKLRREYMVELENGALVTGTIAMVRILRLHQIACGYLPNPDNPEGEPILLCGERDPRLSVALELLEGLPGQTIVWCRFRLDVDRLCRALGKEAVRYDGAVTNPASRAVAIEAFKRGDARYFVANPAAIGAGVTLTQASVAVYYSNSFSLAHRLQSEARNHRIGARSAVTYYDLTALKTVDERIVEVLKKKRDVAIEVQGDKYKEWLQ